MRNYISLAWQTVTKAFGIYMIDKTFAKNRLFEKLKSRNIFWSYDQNTTLEQIGDAIFIEYTLKYADFDELVEIFTLYKTEMLFKIWESVLKNDLRFKKLNLLLARLFFKIDVESSYFQGGMSEREEKLRMFAT